MALGNLLVHVVLQRAQRVLLFLGLFCQLPDLLAQGVGVGRRLRLGSRRLVAQGLPLRLERRNPAFQLLGALCVKDMYSERGEI